MPELALQITLGILLFACVPLTIIDIREHRLPNPITFSAMAIAITGTAIATWLSNDWSRLTTAFAINLTITAIGVVLFLLNGFGLGDVKLLVSLNQVLGFVNPWLVLVSLAVALATSTLYGLVRLAHGSLKMKDRIAFGPFLALGYAVCAVPLIWAPRFY